jgi:hypothetical protein
VVVFRINDSSDHPGRLVDGGRRFGLDDAPAAWSNPADRSLPKLEGVRMAELTADLFVTLDGFASGIDVGPYYGYAGPELDSWVRDQLDQPQLIVMGRVTYQAMAELASSATDEVSTRMNELPKVAFSNTLQEPLAWGNTCLVRGDLAEQVRALKTAVSRSASLDRQHHAGEEHAAPRPGGPAPDYDLSPAAGGRRPRADLSWLSAGQA